MSVTQIDIDDDALERVMALTRAKTKKEAVNLALQFYADKQERAACIARHGTHPISASTTLGISADEYRDMPSPYVSGSPDDPTCQFPVLSLSHQE